MTTGGIEAARERDDPLQAAIANWVWLTGLTRNESALYAGAPAHPLPGILARQFTNVITIAPAADDGLVACDGGSADFIALPEVFTWWRGGIDDLASTTHRILRGGGWLCLSGDRSAPTTPRRLAAILSGGGFGEVRGYFTDGGVAVPWDRRAVKAGETLRAHYHPNPLRRAMVAAGLHSLFYRHWMILAGA